MRILLVIFVFFLLGVSAFSQGQRANKHQNFNSIVETVKTLVENERREKKRATVYISDISKDGDREFAYAYWKEDNSITILNLPLALPLKKGSGEYFWLTSIARIDLDKDVVPTKADIGGSSFLVDRPWVEKIKSDCLKGVRLRL